MRYKFVFLTILCFCLACEKEDLIKVNQEKYPLPGALFSRRVLLTIRIQVFFTQVVQ